MRFHIRFLFCILTLITWILIYSFKVQFYDFVMTTSHETILHDASLHKTLLNKRPSHELFLNEHLHEILQESINKKINDVLRVAVVCYIPSSPEEVHIFLNMLYGSWRYISNKKNEFNEANYLDNVNLLTFTHADNIVVLKTVCQEYNARLDRENNDERCWYIRQDYEIDIGYDTINSFIMFNRSDIYNILKPYKYTMRTDYDTFLTPALYKWKVEKPLVVGKGAYSVHFTRKRLKQISLKLNMTHKGVHDVGSTWFGESNLFINLSKKVLENTAFIYLNEFNPIFPGLRKLKLKKNKDGIWPLWWRPVSLLYGAEVSLNHYIDDFSYLNKGNLDVSSCSNSSIWEAPHIHCWHDNCEFQKFRFIENLIAILKKNISSGLFHRFVDNVYDKDVSKMSIRDYSTFIAWNSVGKYFNKMSTQDYI